MLLNPILAQAIAQATAQKRAQQQTALAQMMMGYMQARAQGKEAQTAGAQRQTPARSQVGAQPAPQSRPQTGNAPIIQLNITPQAPAALPTLPRPGIGQPVPFPAIQYPLR